MRGRLGQPRDWDARTYDSLPLPHERWGADTCGRLDLTGEERVIDFGCGTGRDTMRLLGRLPHGRVIAIDGSRRMLAALRTRVGSDLDRVDVLRSDLNEPISLGHPVDAVFSVATLHWLPDHARVFRHIARTLRRGGQFVSECGGEGNIATVSAALTAILGDTVAKAIWNFADPESTRARLEQAGFTDVEVDLAPDLVAFADTALLETYLETVVLSSHLEGIPTTQRAGLAKRVAAHLPQLELDYVRLRIKARKRVNTAD